MSSGSRSNVMPQQAGTGAVRAGEPSIRCADTCPSPRPVGSVRRSRYRRANHTSVSTAGLFR